MRKSWEISVRIARLRKLRNMKRKRQPLGRQFVNHKADATERTSGFGCWPPTMYVTLGFWTDEQGGTNQCSEADAALWNNNVGLLKRTVYVLFNNADNIFDYTSSNCHT